jgi:hypothetical protein
VKKLILILSISSLLLSSGNKILSSENGRYVFGQISDHRADQYMLDSKTGKLWIVSIDSNTGSRYLVQVEYSSLDKNNKIINSTKPILE